MNGLAFALSPPDNRRLANLCGAMDSNLAQIADALRVQIRRRGARFRVEGDAARARAAESILRDLHARAQDSVDASEIQMQIARHFAAPAPAAVAAPAAAAVESHSPIPKNDGQREYLRLLDKTPVVLCAGPAGTGKTFLAVARALRGLRGGLFARLILCRPAVEAGERLGFLPGDLEQKVNPYLRPLFDALHDLEGRRETEKRIERGEIEIVPLAFMRGRTLRDSFIVADESQNATAAQMKMLVTRLGEGSQLAAVGDTSQIDLPSGIDCGLVDAIRRLRGVAGVGVMTFTAADVVRRPLVRDILRAYERAPRPEPHRDG